MFKSRKLNFFRNAIISFSVILLGAFQANAQRIATVDINRVLESMPAYQKAQDELDKLAKEWRQEIAQEYDVIKGMYSKYQAEQVLLSDDMRKKREDEIMEKERQVRELQKKKFGADGFLFQKRQELVNPIQDQVYSAIEKYSNEKGYDFIFDKGGSSGIIFANSRYDKTDDILSELDLN